MQDLRSARLGFTVGDVLPNWSMEEQCLLQHETDLLPQRFLLEAPHVPPVDLHRPRDRIIEAGDQADDGGLAGSSWSDERRHLPRFDSKTHILENRSVRRVIELHMLKFDLPLEFWCAAGSR